MGNKTFLPFEPRVTLISSIPSTFATSYSPCRLLSCKLTHLTAFNLTELDEQNESLEMLIDIKAYNTRNKERKRKILSSNYFLSYLFVK